MNYPKRIWMDLETIKSYGFDEELAEIEYVLVDKIKERDAIGRLFFYNELLDENYKRKESFENRIVEVIEIEDKGINDFSLSKIKVQDCFYKSWYTTIDTLSVKRRKE